MALDLEWLAILDGNQTPVFSNTNPKRKVRKTIMMGININDKHQPFTEQILDGLKTIETRNTRSLDPYCGQRVGLIRTGKGKATLVGYATLSNYVSYYLSDEQFNNGYREHRVGIESKYHISKSKTGIKFGYELLNVERIEPVEIESRGIVARRID